MRHSITALITITAVMLATAVAGAQPGPGRGRRAPAARAYDPKTVETVTGEVIEIEHPPSRGAGGGVHLVLRTDDGTKVSVRLGPAWYVDRQQVKMAPKDRVEVKGSRVTAEGTHTIIAAEVKKGADTLVLRDAAGIPAWSGAGRRSRP